MPHYEFFCHACEQPFSKTLTPAEYEEGTVLCPHCGSEEVETRPSAFYAVSARESLTTGTGRGERGRDESRVQSGGCNETCAETDHQTQDHSPGR